MTRTETHDSLDPAAGVGDSTGEYLICAVRQAGQAGHVARFRRERCADGVID